MDTFINISTLIPDLIQKSRNEGKKVAFCFSGGGARAAYFGGVIEAIQQEVNKVEADLPRDDRWVPDMICATSGGALASFAYWIECLLPTTPTPYACRQTGIWRHVSEGNRGAEKLFSNHEVLDLISNSDKDVDEFFDSLNEYLEELRRLEVKGESVVISLRSMRDELTTIDTSNLKTDLQNRIQEIKDGFDTLGNPPTGTHAGDWVNYAENAAELYWDILSFLPNLVTDVAHLNIQEIKEFVENVTTVKNNLISAGETAQELYEDAKRLIDDFTTLKNNKIQVFEAVYDSIKDNSSLMNTEGLESVLEDFIIKSYPQGHLPFVNGEIEARELDKAILATIAARKLLNKKVPDLFVTATNINAKRAMALSVAESDSNTAVANRNLWVIQLDDTRVDFQTKKVASGSSVSDFVFGAARFGDETSRKVKPIVSNDGDPVIKVNFVPTDKFSININLPVVDENSPADEIPIGIRGQVKRGGIIADLQNQGLSGTDSFGNVDETAKIASAAVAAANASNDFSKGHSLLVGAVLTSATIPMAFPPRRWRFFSTSNEEYVHWTVDGGVVNNRPVDIAVKAGADIIVSFELTPLLSMTKEMKKIVTDQPTFGRVISSSMVESTLNAGFYRYFEDLVTENALKPPSDQLTIYRMAPMMYDKATDVDYLDGVNWNDQTIGVYDFNGRYDSNRNIQMALFDWFMKGYVDSKGHDPIAPHADTVYKAYFDLPESFGILRNATLGRRSGFFDASLKAHPDTAPPW